MDENEDNKGSIEVHVEIVHVSEVQCSHGYYIAWQLVS